MSRLPKLYSPYGPRPKRSAQLVLIWMAILVVALIITFYLTTRERGVTSSYAGMRLHDEVEKMGGTEPAVGVGGEKMAKMVP
ncbi:hypothetical protein F4804DRAFT_314571 [Jackrogersella minutella]|nr:hypothetical protein F4804DRAFT_314571 [Jackrogersella minutella]